MTVITCEAMLDCSLAAFVTESGVDMTLARSAGEVVFAHTHTRTHHHHHHYHYHHHHTS